MTIVHLLEDFSTAAGAGGPLKLVSDEAMEDLRLSAFEQGYSAGWDDAVSAQGEDSTRIGGALSSSLEDLSFSYHEARGQLAAELEPLFACLTATVLPRVLDQSFGHHIVEQLRQMAEARMDRPAILSVPPGVADTLEPALARDFAIDVELREDTALGDGQARIGIGSDETELDASHLLASIDELMGAYLHQVTEDVQHG